MRKITLKLLTKLPTKYVTSGLLLIIGLFLKTSNEKSFEFTMEIQMKDQRIINLVLIN